MGSLQHQLFPTLSLVLDMGHRWLCAVKCSSQSWAGQGLLPKRVPNTALQKSVKDGNEFPPQSVLSPPVRTTLMRMNSAYSILHSPNLMRLLCFALVLVCAAAQIGPETNFCSEDEVLSQNCHYLAECNNNGTFARCTCPRGTVDNTIPEGRMCDVRSWAVRMVVQYPTGVFDVGPAMAGFGQMLAAAAASGFSKVGSGSCPDFFCDAVYLENHAVYQVTSFATEDVVTFSGLFKTGVTALMVSDEIKTLFSNSDILTFFGATGGQLVWGPQKYAFFTPTTSSYYSVGPSGLEVDSVFFEPNCLDSGCWKIDIKYSVGDDSMNVLYLPRATDGDYDDATNDPVNFPCGSNQWDSETKVAQTACCMPYFASEFRVPEAFLEWLTAESLQCPVTTDSGDDVTNEDWTGDGFSIFGTPGDTQGYPEFPGNFITTAPVGTTQKGKFDGMDLSHVEYTGVIDYTLGIHQARLVLDEHEVRMLAAERAGTIGVQYTLDLYVGIAEFSPTSTKFLDSAMKQVAIHLEKSDFFSVSQHGTIGPGPPVWCCGLGCVPALDQDGTYLGFEVCPPERVGASVNGCVNVEGPFEEGEDPCTTCPRDDPDCTIGVLECQPFYYEGVYYVFPAPDAVPPIAGNVSADNLGEGCCVQVGGDDDNPIYYPPECNTRDTKGCERIYVRSADNPKYPLELLGIPRDQWESIEGESYNLTYIACCEEAAKEDFSGPDCAALPGAKANARAKQRQRYYECRDDLDSWVENYCFACPEGMSDCECGRTICPSDPVSNFFLRLNEVLDPNDPDAPPLQYLQVSFATGGSFQPSPNNGAIALNSVVVAKDTFYEDAVFEQACAGSNNIYDRTSSMYADRWENDCAPENEVCQRVTQLADNFVMFNIPLGPNFYFSNETSLTGDINLYTEFVVTLQKLPSLQTFATLVKLSYPLVPGGINTWCQAVSLATDLQQVANVDLLVGSAMTKEELPRLMLFEDIAGSKLDPANATEFDTVSIESGLMTLVLKGNSSYFELPGTQVYKLELEDVMTLHFMENGDDTWESLLELVNRLDNGAAAFEVQTDRWGHRAFLMPSDELREICTFSPRLPTVAAVIPSVCIARRDIADRVPFAPVGGDNTAIELTAANVDGAVTFMNTIFGATEYTERLARNFSAIVRDHWDVNERYIRAWWINPGYEWTPGAAQREIDRFTISQKLVMFCLVNLNEGFAVRRAADELEEDPMVRNPGSRMLLATGLEDTRNGLGGSSMQFPITATEIVCQALGCDMEAMTQWQLTAQLSEEETCYDKNALNDLLRGRFKKHLKGSESTSAYESVQIIDIVVDLKGVRCTGGRRLLQSGGGTATARTIILWKESSAVVNVDEIVQAADGALLSMTATEAAPAGITVVSTGQPSQTPQGDDDESPSTESPGATPQESTEDDEDSNGRQITIIMAVVFFVVGSVLIVAAGLIAWRMKLGEEEEAVTVVEALSPEQLKERTGVAPLAAAQPEF